MTRYRFIGTPLELLERESYHLGKYLKKARQKGRLLSYEQFDFDMDALLTLVQLDCANCHLAHQESCCEGGFPFPPEQELLPVLGRHQQRIVTGYLSAEATELVAESGLYAEYLETGGWPTIREFQGNCLFCRVEGNGPACMAHRYAQDIGVVPEDLKPLSCLLYPLDLIADQETGRVLITALTEHTARFSRWGEDYYQDYVCGNHSARMLATAEDSDLRANIRRALPTDVFALAKYRPAYQEGKATLVTLYGEEVWQRIDEAAQKTQQGKEA